MFLIVVELGMLLIGSILTAVSFTGFIIPNDILAGGLTGICMFISHFTGFGIGVIYFILNIPLFLWGYKELGSRFIIYSGITVVLLSFLIDLSILYIEPFTGDPLLGGIFGGLLGGIGLILILRAGGSNGGMDIVCIIFNRRYGLSVGQIMLAINAVVLSMAVFMYSMDQTMYTLISIFATTMVMEMTQGIQRRKSIMIISAKHEELTKSIWQHLKRGVTYLHGQGAYSHSQTEIIMCVMTRFELNELKRLVLKIDPQAFMTVTTLDEVVGYFRTDKSTVLDIEPQKNPTNQVNSA